MIEFLKTILATLLALITSYQLGAITIVDIENAENSYYQRNGKYLQIINGQLPPHESGTIRKKLGIDIPSNITIHEYSTPDGKKGFQVITENPDNISSMGYGVQSQIRTYTIDKSVTNKSASTTP